MEEETKTFIIREMPVSLYRQFKSVCASTGYTMREAHMELMKKMITSAGTVIQNAGEDPENLTEEKSQHREQQKPLALAEF